MFRRSPVPTRIRQAWPDGAVLVGGAARDLLRGSEPRDWDWAAPEPRLAAERLATVLGGSVFALGTERAHYRVTSASEQHDFVPLPLHLDDDLLRRDFTVNALAIHASGAVSDPAGGLQDLQARQLRMISEANLRADPLRLLRAARLSLTLNFRTETKTREAVMRLARAGLPLPAQERIRGELHAMLRHPQAARGIQLLEELGLLALYLPELREGKRMFQGDLHHLDVFSHAVEALGQLISRCPESSLALRWATLLHDVGKPSTRQGEGLQVQFPGHETAGAELARRVLERLREPQALVQEVTALIAAHMLLLPTRERETKRFVHHRRAVLPGLLHLMQANRDAARGEGVSEASRVRFKHELGRVLTVLASQPPQGTLLSGQDIMKLLKLPPGQEVGEAVQALAEAQAMGDVQDAHDAKNWLLTGLYKRPEQVE